MKKLWAIPFLAAAICMGATACSDSDKNVDQNGANVFPVSYVDDGIAVAMGDVMPFYDNGIMNIYHLRDSGQSPFFHPIARITTTDFIHYTADEKVSLNFDAGKPDSVDAALGTGSCIKGNDGVYHFFYTGHNGYFNGEVDKETGKKLPYTEVVRHATSTNQTDWDKDEDFLLYGWENDFRDPYVYYDDTDDIYYMLVTTRDSGKAVIKRYSAQTLDATANEWNEGYVDNFFTNDDGDYNMECPSFVQLGNFYYLAYSEQGDNRVTHYRYKESHDGEWKKFERDSIDASGFYAGRLEKAGDKLYAFAWCARLSGGSTGGFDWGGNLVTHELVQKENGELCAVMPKSYKDFFSHEVIYNTVDGEKVEGFTFDGEQFTSYGAEKLSDNVTRMSLTIEVNGDEGDFGLSFGLSGDYNNRLGSAVIAFDIKNNSVTCYNEVSSILRYGVPLASVAFNYEKDKEFLADIIIDGEVITVYLDGEIALTARITDMKQSNFAFYSNGAKSKIQDVKFYE